jgi:hypothetical protein
VEGVRAEVLKTRRSPIASRGSLKEYQSEHGGDVRRKSVPDLRIEYNRPWLYPKQKAAMFTPKRISLIESSTKAGKTFSAIVWLHEEALRLGKPGRHFWWVAPITAQAEIAFTRMVRGLPPGTFNAWRGKGSQRIVLLNGAIISFHSGDHPDALYGEDVWGVVVDEASRVKEGAWHAIRTTMTKTQGRVRIIGNVKGRRNWFYMMARKAEKGEDPDSHYAKITWRDAVEAKILRQSEIDSVQKSMPDVIFRELYLAEAGDDSGNPFGLDKLRSCYMNGLSGGEPRWWSWDLAKSQDWTVGVALDDEGRVCRFHRFQAPTWDQTEKIIVSETDSAPSYVDSSGVGDPIVERLIREGGSNFEGFKFTTQSKQQLMEGLMAAVHKSEIRIPAPDHMPASTDDPVHLALELESFEYEQSPNGHVRYSAPEGQHDDAVMALAMVVARRQAGGGFDDYSWVGTLPRNFGRQYA